MSIEESRSSDPKKNRSNSRENTKEKLISSFLLRVLDNNKKQEEITLRLNRVMNSSNKDAKLPDKKRLLRERCSRE